MTAKQRRERAKKASAEAAILRTARSVARKGSTTDADRDEESVK